MINRRTFVKKSALATGALSIPFLQNCNIKSAITGSLSGPDFSSGHRLREKLSGKPSQILKSDIVIVGGGVSGLSAGRWLYKNHCSFQLLELEHEIGGNSRAGENSVSAYPLGAHYLPIPSIENTNLLHFLEECGLIKEYSKTLPVFDEYSICFDPKERLYINHHWQDGLVPHEGVPLKDRAEIKRFLEMMTAYRNLKGNDGKWAFEIPLEHSSQDDSILPLDRISMTQFLSNNGFNSEYLHWYVNYCCADDYGASLNDVSAWAGIHYFASRRGEGANAGHEDVLTWPEGNHWLIKQLRSGFEDKISKRTLVTSVSLSNAKVQVDYLDISSQKLNRIEAEKVILAAPQFVNQYLLQHNRGFSYSIFQYAPWMVANLTVNSSLNEKRGEPLSWDNVIYGSQSLGYVHAGHQKLNIPGKETVITYYQPLTSGAYKDSRNDAQKKTWGNWKDIVLNELKPAHPKISEETTNIDVWIWGHGMVRPGLNFIWSKEREMAKKNINNKIYFAHTDICGISIFEEAFNIGIEVAKEIQK